MDKDNDGLVMLIPGEEPSKVTSKTEEPVTEDPEAIDVFNFFADNDELNPQRLWKPWMDEKKFVLGTVDNITQIIDECIESGRYALDLETTGLDNRLKKTASGHYCTVDHIAGVCLSADGVTGYYIPIHHVKVGEDGLREDRACNIPIGIFDREFRRLIKATEDGLTVADFHNGKFDQEFLQFNETGIPWGEWDRPAMWDDTLIAAYMRNTRARRRGLKALSEAPVDSPPENTVGGPGLGMEMIDLYELWGHKKEQRGFNYDFSVLDPTEGPALWYGCSDAICTWLLDPVLMPSAKEKDTDGISQAAIYKIEKVCVAATRWMERNLIHINRDKVQELVSLGQQEWFDSIVEVYTEASKMLGRDVMPDLYKEVQRNFVANDPDNLLRTQLEKADSLTKRNLGMPPVLKGEESWPAVYDVNSQKQLGTMFNEMEVPGLKFTEKSGQVKTSKDELNRIIEEAGQKFPFMAKIKRFREVAKALSTYLESMLLASDPEDDSMRINFNGHKVDTGRFSTPAKESAGDRRKGRMIGWPELNVQSMPNRYDPDRPECMNRLRECFGVRTVPKDAPPRFLVAIDYAGVELRLATNISGEPKWLAEFFHCSSCDRTFERTPRTGADIIATITPVPPPARCPNCGSDKIGDLHTLTGLSIYGADATSRPDWKNLRGHSKATNFALSYGGGGSAVCRATGVDRNEGQRIKNQFDNTYYGLKRWWNSQHKYAKTYGYVRTAFGRKYPVPDIYNEDGGFRSKAERNSVNGPIQGSSADITKTAMALIYKECKRRGWLDKVAMNITMHDELVFEVDADVLEEAVPVLVDLMVANDYILVKNWPVPFTTDVEIGTDWTVPWDLNAMRHGEVRFHEGKKYGKKKDLPEGAVWEDLPSWPEELVPWFKEAQGGSIAEVSVSPTLPSVALPEGEVPEVPCIVPVTALAPTAVPGEDYFFQLPGPMTYKLAGQLAEIIAECHGKGSSPLRLRTVEGIEIEGWLEGLNLTTIRVSPVQLETLIQYVFR